jgi:hypothetical protein
MSKVIVAGPRDYNNYTAVCDAILDSGVDVTEVVSGGAKGVDSLGERWAKENDVPVKKFVADWNKYGRSAGPLRNKEMVNYADTLIAIVPYTSPGTTNVIKQALDNNLRVFKYTIKITP